MRMHYFKIKVYIINIYFKLPYQSEKCTRFVSEPYIATCLGTSFIIAEFVGFFCRTSHTKAHTHTHSLLSLMNVHSK